MSDDSSPHRRTLLLGWKGGVATAALHLLAGHPVGRALLAGIDELVLADGDPSQRRSPLARARVLRPAPVRATPARGALPAREALLGALLDRHRISSVIDLARLDTWQCVRTCAARGVHYLNAGLETPDEPDAGGAGASIMARALDLLPGRRPAVDGAHLIVGSGMNPGLVSALLAAGLAALAARVGRPRGGLDLYAILVTEEDSTTASGGDGDGEIFPMSWSPRQCLEEVLEPRAMIVRGGAPVALDHPPHRALYRARCGDREIAGMIVPHEELVSFGARHPEAEVAYVYRLPRAARRALAAHPARRAAEWATARWYPPHRCDLRGHDRVGVLLCSRRHGELWIGFDTPMALGLRWSTGATELQVAAGVLAGWRQLGDRRGLELVEELSWQPYLAAAEAILGPAQVVFDPRAPVRPLAERRARDDEAS